MLVLDVAHSDFPPKHDVLWSIFPKPQVQYMSIWGFLPCPSIWTHHDTPVFAKTRGCGPITCCPSAGVGTPPLHKPVSSDGRFGGTKRANPQGMGSIPMMNLFFGGAWIYVYQVKLCGFNKKYQGMFLLMPMIFERHGYMRFEKNTDNLHFFSIPDPEGQVAESLLGLSGSNFQEIAVIHLHLHYSHESNLA